MCKYIFLIIDSTVVIFNETPGIFIKMTFSISEKRNLNYATNIVMQKLRSNKLSEDNCCTPTYYNSH